MANDSCPCKNKKCERHGNCEECREYHHTTKRKSKTVCERKKAHEEREKERKLKDSK